MIQILRDYFDRNGNRYKVVSYNGGKYACQSYSTGRIVYMGHDELFTTRNDFKEKLNKVNIIKNEVKETVIEEPIAENCPVFEMEEEINEPVYEETSSFIEDKKEGAANFYADF